MKKKIIQTTFDADPSLERGLTTRRKFLSGAAKVGIPAVVALSSRGAWGRSVDCTSASNLAAQSVNTFHLNGGSVSCEAAGVSLVGLNGYTKNVYKNSVATPPWPPGFAATDSGSTVQQLFTGDFGAEAAPASGQEALTALGVPSTIASSTLVKDALALGSSFFFAKHSFAAMLNARGGVPATDFLTPDEVVSVILNRAVLFDLLGSEFPAAANAEQFVKEYFKSIESRSL